MYKNYLSIAWRQLTKGKMHSFINISGLAIAMAVTILIGLWVYDELSYDKNFEHYDRIVQIEQHVLNNGELQTWPQVPFPLAAELRTHYGSDFDRIAMAQGVNEDHMLTIGDKKLRQKGGFFEKEAPELFTLNMTQGNRNGLSDPSSVLLSVSAAKICFGNADPINKMIQIDQFPPVKVTGVYDDFPNNSSLADVRFISSWDFFYSHTEWIRTLGDPWRPNFITLYAQLTQNASIANVSARIRDVKLNKVNAALQKKKPALFLHPMKDWHLRSDFRNGVNVGGAIEYVWMFGVIGACVLLLACINFMNLSTARSEKRAKEVGIRKTIGSSRKQLILQFFGESLLIVTLSFSLSLLLVELSLPLFNVFADKQLTVPWNNQIFWITNALVVLCTSVLAGSYPALYLSSFRPVKVLKGTFKAARFAAVPRKALVVIQFTVSVALIIATLIVYRQIQYAKNRSVGYSRNNLVVVPVTNNTIHDHFEAVSDELKRNGAVVSVAESQSTTTAVGNSTSGISWPGKDPNLSTDFGVVFSSIDYGKTIGWHIKDGRDFSRQFLTDSSGLILNAAAVKYMGLKHPVGETITWFDQQLKVVGVIDDLIMGSPYEETRPIVYGDLTGGGGTVIMRLNPATEVKTAIEKISTVIKKFNPGEPFEYSFTDQDYAKKFGDEERVGKLSGFFALLAITISALGLVGLTSFVAEQRKKEIGVRKILGASVFSVWNLLSKEFLALVALSFVISIPISYYYMHAWLQHYAYRTELSWWIFTVAGAGALLITIVVVSFQAIKAAIANPVKSLRTE